MMWELSIETIGLVVVVIAALIQTGLDYFWGERPDRLRRRWACILVVFIIAGAIANIVGDRQSQAKEREERERIERAANEREQQATEERQEISAKMQVLVTLARENDPDLTEQEALRKITTEVRTLREQTSQLKQELQGLRRYREMAKYDVLGLKGIGGAGIKENSPINQALEGAYIEEETQTGSVYYPRCDDQGIARFEIVAREFPNFPFSYWALATCLKQMGEPQWREYGERAMSIFQHTTQISERKPAHDQALKQIEKMLTE